MYRTHHVFRAILALIALVTLVAGTPLAAYAQAKKGGHAPAHKDTPPADPTAAPEPTPPPPSDPAKDPKAHEPKEDAEGEPQSMALVVFLEKLTKFDLGPGIYNGEFYLVFRCEKEPCKPDPHPTNGKFTSREEEKATSPLEKIFKVKAELEATVDLSEFPFDSHTLPLSIEDKNEAVTYHFDPSLNAEYLRGMGIASTVNPGVKLAGWTIDKDMRAHIVKQKIGANVDEQLVFDIAISRPTLASLFKTLVPVFFMVFVAAFTLLLKPKSAAGRLSAATGGLMTVVMFHLSATSSLPPLGYLTRMDKFMIATYIVYLLNIMFAVAIVRFDEKKAERNAELAYLTALGAIPGAALLSWLTVFLKVA
jgi:hypothetical protein